DPRPKGDGTVKDVPGEYLLELDVEIGRIGELEGGQEGEDSATVVAQLDGGLGLDDDGTVVLDRPGVLDERVGREEAGERRVEAQPVLVRGYVEIHHI